MEQVKIKGIESVQHLKDQITNSGRPYPGFSAAYIHFIREEILEKILDQNDPSYSEENISGSVQFIEDAHCAHLTLANGIAAIGYILTKADGIEESSSDILGNLGWFIQDIGGLINAFESISYDAALKGLRLEKGGAR